MIVTTVLTYKCRVVKCGGIDHSVQVPTRPDRHRDVLESKLGVMGAHNYSPAKRKVEGLVQVGLQVQDLKQVQILDVVVVSARRLKRMLRHVHRLHSCSKDLECPCPPPSPTPDIQAAFSLEEIDRKLGLQIQPSPNSAPLVCTDGLTEPLDEWIKKSVSASLQIAAHTGKLQDTITDIRIGSFYAGVLMKANFPLQKQPPLIVELFTVLYRLILPAVTVVPDDPVVVEMWICLSHYCSRRMI